jgi:hypothetical protein
MPIGKKISAENLFVKDKYVSEELRNLAMEKKILLVTAAQLNRGAVEEVEFDHSHISGGLSKIQTADNVFGIFTSRAMRERGRYQIQLMKTRSSSGVGQKIDLAFNVDTLRIFDNGEDPGYTAGSHSGSSLLSRIKASSQIIDQDTGEVINTEPAKKVVADVQSNKLSAILNQIKAGNS